jgi:hypothetical protein
MRRGGLARLNDVCIAEKLKEVSRTSKGNGREYATGAAKER